MEKTFENESIKEQFKNLENRIDTFVRKFLKEKIFGKERELKIMFTEPIHSKGLENDYDSSFIGIMQMAYIKSITCYPYTNDKEKFYIETTATNRYREENEDNVSYKSMFQVLCLDDKAMIASALEDGDFFIVENTFRNYSYKVISDTGCVYNSGDIVNVISIARDFLESCNEREDADLIGYVYSELYHNRGEELITFICEAWNGLSLKRIN